MTFLRSLEPVAKAAKIPFSSFRRKPESSNSNKLRKQWTPVFTGVTAFATGSLPLLFFSTLTYLLISAAPASAVVLSVGSNKVDLRRGNTVAIDITVDDPAAIAGASLTVAYDTQSLELLSVASNFFAPFAEQFAALPGAGDPFVDPADGKIYVPVTYQTGTIKVPAEVTIGQFRCTQPLIMGRRTGQGTMLTAARVVPGESANHVLFTLSFKVSSATDANYEITLTPSAINNSVAGYPPGGESIPMLIGALAPGPGQDLTDPAMFPAVPVEQINAGRISVLGSKDVVIIGKPTGELVVESGERSALFTVTGGDDTIYTWTTTDNHGKVIDTANGVTYAFTAPADGDFAGRYTVMVADNQGFSDYFIVRVPIVISPPRLTFTEIKLDGSENPQAFSVTGADGNYTWDILEAAGAGEPAANPEEYGRWLQTSPVFGDNTNTLVPADVDTGKSFHVRVTVENDADLTAENGLNRRSTGPFFLVPVAEFTVMLSDNQGAIDGSLLKAEEITVREVSTDQSHDLLRADGRVSFLLPLSGGTFEYEVEDRRAPAVYIFKSVSSSDRMVAITMEKAGPDHISGMIMDVNGFAVTGARVCAYQPETVLAQYETVSTADGSYAITLPLGAPLDGWTVVVTHPDYIAQRQEEMAIGTVDFTGEHALYSETMITSITATAGESSIRIDITASPAITDVNEVAIVLESGSGLLGEPAITSNIEDGATVTVVYNQVNDFRILVAVDTSEDHDPYSGYRATQPFIFNASPLLKAVSWCGIGKAGGKAMLQANKQTAEVEIPAGGVAAEDTSVVIEQFQRNDNGGRPGYAYEISVLDSTSGRELTDEQIDYIKITLPLDLSMVNPGDLENGRVCIRHAHDLNALLAGRGLAVPTSDIISTEYIGDGQTGSVTFHVGSLSAFEMALTDPGGPEDPSGASPTAGAGTGGGGGGGGGCFISTAADTRLLDLYAYVLQRLRALASCCTFRDL